MREGRRRRAPRRFAAFLDEVGWTADDIDKTFCHQVGVAHRKLMFEVARARRGDRLCDGRYLGNTGSVALPMTAALGIESGHLATTITSRCWASARASTSLMLAVDWQRSWR